MKRDASIPKPAKYDEASQTYQLGSRKDHRWQIWHPCGRAMLDASFKDGKLDGRLYFNLIGEFAEYKTNHFEFGQQLVKQLDLPDGDDMSELIATYERGALREAKFTIFGGEDNEIRKVVATYGAAGLEKLRWVPSGTAQSVFKHGDIAVSRKDMKIPKPWPAAIELGFVKNKIKTRVYLDKKGAALPAKAAPAKVTDWGQQAKSVDGYIANGTFAKDLKAFFPEVKRGETDPDAKRAKKLFAQLPAKQQAAALAFDALVPALTRADPSGYGFDCVKNKLYNATDKKYFGLSYTSDGDLQLLDVETGRVLEWVHDYDPFEDDAIFASLDAYAFAILRIELAALKRIAVKDVAVVFKRLGFGWATKLI